MELSSVNSLAVKVVSKMNADGPGVQSRASKLRVNVRWNTGSKPA